MKLLILFTLSFYTALSQAGEWVRIDQKTLTFTGAINSDEFQKFSSVFDSNVTKIIVDSQGGDALAGIEIGEVLVKNTVDIEVQGLCGSSCANSIFAAGKRKIIKNGAVGFHGNINAGLNVDGVEGFKKALLEKGFPEALLPKAVEQVLAMAQREAALISATGVSQDLFDRTYLKDKGMGDGKEYFALFPTPETFEHYGFKNVEGDQSIDFLETDPRITKFKDLGTPYVVD